MGPRHCEVKPACRRSLLSLMTIAILAVAPQLFFASHLWSSAPSMSEVSAMDDAVAPRMQQPDDTTGTSTRMTTSTSIHRALPRIVCFDQRERDGSSWSVTSCRRRNSRQHPSSSDKQQLENFSKIRGIQPYYARFEQWDVSANETGTCQPAAEWQTTTYPTCNIVHELPLNIDNTHGNDNLAYSAIISELLGQGGWRNVFRLDEANITTVVKISRYHKDDFRESLERHRVDAVAMERLTSRPDIASAFAYCGTAVVTEYLDGGSVLDARHWWRKENDRKKLVVGFEVANALAALHYIPPSMDGARATMSHGDLMAKNVMLDLDAKVKLVDLNQATPIYVDPSTGKSCLSPFGRHRFLTSVFRPPERKAETRKPLATEKFDIYHLGIILYQIMSRKRPAKPEVAEEIELRYFDKAVANPSISRFVKLSDNLLESDDLLVQGLLYATMACLIATPEYRPTSVQIAKGMQTVLEWHEQGANKTRRDVQRLYESNGIRLFK